MPDVCVGGCSFISSVKYDNIIYVCFSHVSQFLRFFPPQKLSVKLFSKVAVNSYYLEKHNFFKSLD